MIVRRPPGHGQSRPCLCAHAFASMGQPKRQRMHTSKLPITEIFDAFFSTFVFPDPTFTVGKIELDG